MIANPIENDVFWPWLTLASLPSRPLYSTPQDQKNETYDSQCARYYLGNLWVQYRNTYLREYAANLRGAIGGRDAWGSAEAIREFLGDENNPTGRLALQYMIQQPMLTRLVGAADNLSITARAEAATQLATTRKEADLAQALLYSQAAQAGPMMAGAMAQKGVTPNEEETEMRHENYYQDQYVKAENSLLTMMGIHQELDRKKRPAALNLALSGVAATFSFANGNNIECELLRPEEIGWDPSAVRPDFSDGSYVYCCPLMDVSDIAERYQPSKEKILSIDKWASFINSSYQGPQGWPQRKPRVITTYFKDWNVMEYGFVMKDDEPHYCPINVPSRDSRDGTPEYTDKDLIDPPENQFTVSWSNLEVKQKKQRRYVQVVRYCTMIPWEYLPGPFTEGKPYKDRAQLSAEKRDLIGPTGDLILDSGEYPLQEAEPDATFSVKFPIKFATWMYMGGIPVAPLSAARDPQMVMNAVLSDMIWRMEKTGIPTIAYDSDAVAAGGMKEADFLRGLKTGSPVKAKGSLLGGIPQSISVLDTSPGASFYSMFNILDRLYAMAQNATGIYDQNFGAPGQSDQLVGTKQLQLQQSSIMQQPFYAAIQDLFEQIHQFNAQAGKQFYARRPWALKQMTGDEGAQALIMSDDMQNEQFRVEVKLTVGAEQIKKYVDEVMIPNYIQLGMLDPASAANLVTQSYPEDVAAGARAFTQRMQQAAQQQAEDQQKQMQMDALMQQKQMLDQQQQEADSETANLALQTRAQDIKASAPYRQADSQNLDPNTHLAIADMATQQQATP